MLFFATLHQLHAQAYLDRSTKFFVPVTLQPNASTTLCRSGSPMIGPPKLCFAGESRVEKARMPAFPSSSRSIANYKLVHKEPSWRSPTRSEIDHMVQAFLTRKFRKLADSSILGRVSQLLKLPPLSWGMDHSFSSSLTGSGIGKSC
ncbi:hypothetical protein PsorP6_011483 [Peronosclerospora sorghi]|uniref:Uncharacterized protein n=1 Tax=Peronosclerospora sorghi TaxID=230839 RepID=A0ACC0WLI1_9STRA|nr:hypothetical protein PsorP6_011483 [Peronosclerospora sorghi]